MVVSPRVSSRSPENIHICLMPTCTYTLPYVVCLLADTLGLMPFRLSYGPSEWKQTCIRSPNRSLAGNPVPASVSHHRMNPQTNRY
jgi:hypothetical protein